MKGILGLLRSKTIVPKSPDDSGDSTFFSTAFAGQGVDDSLLVPWDVRAAEMDAKRIPPQRGSKLLQGLLAEGKITAQLPAELMLRLEHFLEFAQLPSDRDVVRQDEYGNFMFFLLSGTMAVNRVQPWGERLLLAQTQPGDVIGEMSLLDSGIRFSTCTTMSECEIAVLTAEALDEMMVKDPQVAAALVAVLARKLSLRLRKVSLRLSENQSNH